MAEIILGTGSRPQQNSEGNNTHLNKMESNKNKVTDILGLAPYGDAIKIAVEKGFEGASALLSRICLPAAGELGLMYQDKIRYWRLKNIIRIMETAEGKFDFSNDQLQIHPRVIHEIMEEGSWCEDNTLQNMWAGLLSASCDVQVSDSNILFLKILKHLTSTQAKIVNLICSTCKVRQYNNVLIQGRSVILTIEELFELTGIGNIEQLDSELDNLRANDLITFGGGFQVGDNPLVAKLKPSAFLLNLYAKTQGFQGSLIGFYKDRLIEEDDDEQQGGRILIV